MPVDFRRLARCARADRKPWPAAGDQGSTSDLCLAITLKAVKQDRQSEETMPRNTAADLGGALISNEPSSRDADSRPREFRPRARTMSCSWFALFSDGRRASDVQLEDLRDPAAITIDGQPPMTRDTVLATRSGRRSVERSGEKHLDEARSAGRRVSRWPEIVSRLRACASRTSRVAMAGPGVAGRAPRGGEWSGMPRGPAMLASQLGRGVTGRAPRGREMGSPWTLVPTYARDRVLAL
jgi:hypothetical protein